MRGYFVRRVLLTLPILVGVTSLTFVLFHLFGGDPAAEVLGKSATGPELAQLRREYGLDLPIGEQYLGWLLALARLDLGRSFVTREPVTDMLGAALGPTLCLTLPVLVATFVLALSASLLAVCFRGTLLDRAVMVASVLGMSLSLIVYVVVGQYLFAFALPLFEIHGYKGGPLERWPFLALPICVLTLVGLGHDVRFFRAVLSAELDEPHTTTARAKGLTHGRVVGVHVLKSALVPIVTRAAVSVPFLVTGSLLVESFFGIPGLGGLLYEAIDRADFPVIQAYTALTSIVCVAAHLGADLISAALDPRVRLAP